jgi:spore germination cell wall hydrolase CwlJ-like protein
MRFNVQIASVLAVAATMITAAASTSGSSASAQDLAPGVTQTQSTLPLTVAPLAISPAATLTPLAPSIEQGPSTQGAIDQDVDQVQAPAAGTAATLADFVQEQAQPETLTSEMKCLAGAIYFEAKGETLAGQLAVGRVIVNRAKSGRFPDNYCGVVYQRSQFSFIHGKTMPAIRTASRDWQRAVAIAEIAHNGSWKSQCEGALYFHAARVSPAWHKTRIARVDDHVFYR